ncbi:cytoplasm protein [Crassisporium funariophilum]|nr:cytoplasm protein [Crassisporium funariophilum]
MSRRSYDSFAHEKRLSKYRVSDDDLFDYVLRVALLSYMMLPKVAESPKVPAVIDAREREHSSRLSALSNFSIGDVFRDVRDGSKSVKFPERLLKVLEQKLQDIAMGKDAAYSDQLVRRTMAKFYGQFMVDSFKRQMKENRKIEELILMFATHATSVLRKEPTLAGDGWKLELNNQIAQFIKMLRECLRNVNHVSPELVSRLDTYTAKLAPTLALGQGYSHSDSGYDSSSTSNRESVSVPTISANVADMHMVKIVANLFKIPDQAIQKEVDALRGSVVSEKAAMTDLKTCLKNINAGAPFPGRREDFETEAAWHHWRHLETTHLQQLMVIMVQFNPELAKSTPSDILPSLQTSNMGRPGSLYSQVESPISATRHASVSSRRSLFAINGELNPQGYDDPPEGEDDLPVGHHFTFIPPNPKKFYKRLVEYCLVADLEVMMSPEVDDNDEVSLGILSHPHIELINECAVRWRIGHSYRAACFLDLVKQFYERNDVPMECIPEALQNVTKVAQETEVELWPVADVDYVANVHAGLFNLFLSSLYHAMDSLPNLKPSELQFFLSVLENVRDFGLLSRFDIDIEARIHDVRDRIRQVAVHWFEVAMQEKQAAPGVNRALPLLLMTDEMEKGAKGLDKRFPEPLLGKLDIVSLFVEVAVPRLMADLQQSQKRLFESSMNGPTPDVPIQDIFALYRRTKTLMGMYKAFVPEGTFDFNITAFFEPYVRQWLKNTDDKTKNWVDAAIAQDKFEAEGTEGHSSSIVDLFDSLRSPINFLQELEWEDEYQEGRFFTGLSKTISKAIEQYCRSVEAMFLTEMFPRPADFLQPQKSSAWLEKARQLAITGEKRVEPFNFRPESCVKLNNVEAARKLLDKMYTQMEADRIAEVLSAAPPVPEKQDRDRFLFSVKVVIAEGLVPLDSSPSSKLDTFVTLSDEAGNRLAKTRTIYESLGPRWDETFDLSVDKPLWVMVSVRDRSLVGKHDIVGRAYLCLDPRRFSDFLAHELWMDLDTHGRILVRVSMEGEKDDIQFFFGRAFRSLKRAEADMLRIFIDKMSPFIQQCLSRNVVKTLMKSRDPGMDYNKALGNVTALYRSALGSSASSEPQIPLPSTEKPRVRPEELTDVEIEQAILPLFDYFDANLQTLNTYLSDSAKEMVMTRVWKEILTVIEGLLIPPLSELASDMKPLSDKEVDIVFRWLKFLRDYFYANGEGPVPLEVLQNQKYRDVVSIRLYYDWHTDALMEECVRMMQQSLRSAPSMKKRAKSVYSQRNLGTIKERKKEKRQETEVTSEQTIMRILRMRPRTSEFIAQQMQIMAAMQAEQEQRAKEVEERKMKRQQNHLNNQIPAVPPLPPLPES